MNLPGSFDPLGPGGIARPLENNLIPPRSQVKRKYGPTQETFSCYAARTIAQIVPVTRIPVSSPATAHDCLVRMHPANRQRFDGQRARLPRHDCPIGMRQVALGLAWPAGPGLACRGPPGLVWPDLSDLIGTSTPDYFGCISLLARPTYNLPTMLPGVC